MGERGHYAIRDRLRMKPDVDMEPERVDLIIGRKVIRQQTYGISEKQRLAHPLYQFVNELAHDPANANRGVAVDGMDLHLRLLSSETLHRVITNRPGYKHINSNSRKRRNYYHDIAHEVRLAFREQQQEDPITLHSRAEVQQPVRLRQHVARSVAMFESDIEFIDYEVEERANHAYQQRGEAHLVLSKRSKTLDTGETVVRPLMDDEFNLSVLLDDMHRINEALKSAGLAGGRTAGLMIDDLDAEIPIFVSASGTNERPVMPRVPMGFVSVQPLAIWET